MVYERWVDFEGKVRRYFRYSIEEKRNLILITIVFGFLYSMRDWGPGDEINIIIGLTNFLIATVLYGITVYVHVSAQRLHALRVGHKPEFRMWSHGIVGAVIIAILFRGYWWAVIPFFGTTELHQMVGHRLGKFRYGINTWNIGLVCLTGCYVSLILAYLLKILNLMFDSSIIEKFILMNLMLAVLTMLPIPPLTTGIRVFGWSRLSYVFNFFMILAAASLIWFSNNIFFILVGSVFVGTVFWFIFYVSYEEDTWGG